MQRVPLLDLTRIDADETEELRAAFDRVLGSGMFVLGPEVTEFEREVAEWLGARHALGVSSGTDALLLALMTLDIGPGDEVVCPTYTFFATAGTVWRTGARPVFCDIDPRTFNCDAADVAAKITPRTKAIMPVHLYGQSAEMGPLLTVSREAGIPIIEDAAQAIGARYSGERVGTLGEFGCYSFFPTKNLGCLGDGGLVVTDDAALAERAAVLRVHGGKPKYYHGVVGGNFRIDALQSAFLRVKLRRLDRLTAVRCENAATYRRLFEAAGVTGPADGAPGRIELPYEGPHGHTWNQFVIRVSGPAGERDALRGALGEHGIGTEIYYPVPLHLQECFRSLGHRPGDFPASERASEQTLALPIFPGLSAAELERVVEVIAGWCRDRSR